MRSVISSIEGEFRRYKSLAEKAIEQLDNAQVTASNGQSNSIAVIVRHIGGNLRSRFTEFLTTDGEKPWRDRDTEFEQPDWTRAELLAWWEKGWRVLFDTTAALTDADLSRNVTIRSQALSVAEALHRSLAHVSYHVGQIVYIAKDLRDVEWKNLSIPLRKSAEVNEKMRAGSATRA